jgi:tetratricopeptide (TPR) repeat protein
VLGVLVVLGLAPTAALVSSRMPTPLVSENVALPTEPLDAATAIRAVPVGLAPGTRIRSIEDVVAYATAAVGATATDLLLDLIGGADGSVPGTALDPDTWDYPYRFPVVEQALTTADSALLEQHGAALGAALLLYAADPSTPSSQSTAASRVAFAVLDRARASGACDPQLNLLALLAADQEIARETIGRETGLAQEACRTDPTPWWLSVMRSLNDLSGEAGSTELDEFTATGLSAAEATAGDLVRRFPADPGGLATYGDVLLTKGQNLATSQPFTARAAFRDAETVFRRLEGSGEATAARLGRAHALLGLGRSQEAATAANDAAARSAKPGRALQVLVSSHERSHDYPSAAGTAKRLSGIGPSAFPLLERGVVPIGAPLSFGADLLTPVHIFMLALGQGGGGLVADEGFIPVYREAYDLTDDAPFCPEWLWRRDVFLAGDAAGAARAWPTDFTGIDPMQVANDCPDGERLRQQIDHTLNGPGRPDVEDADVRKEVEALYDNRQNLLRWAGDLPGARREAATWAAILGPDTAVAHQRLGEIDYLRQQFDSAAAHFAQAAVRWRAIESENDLAVHQVQLAQGAALLRAGRKAEAVAVLQPLLLEGAQGYGYQTSQETGYADAFATVSYYAASLLGEHELTSGHPHAAQDDFAVALSWSDTLAGSVHVGTARNAAALAALGTGDTTGATDLASAAVATDPASPVYLMTAAEVAQRAGNTTKAIRLGRAALEADPSNYPAANNLGVVLARQGHVEQASQVLRAAVHARPEYALGWFNLGIVEGRRGPLHVLPSQGALGRAITLDEGFADQPHHTVLDTALYRTGLDVSKPIPAGWTFAGSQRTAPVVTLGLFAAVLAGIGLISLRDPAPGSATEWLETLGSRLGRLRVGRALRRPWWAVAATVAAFLLAFWRDALWPWTGVLYVACLLALMAAAMVARWLVARRRVTAVVHGTWSPGVLVGLVSGAFGAPIAPLPVVRAPVRDARVALAAPLTLAVLSLALLLEAALVHTPLTTTLCIAAFIMAGSVLLPVKPLDGSRAGAAGVAGAAGLLGAVLLLGLGLV